MLDIDLPGEDTMRMRLSDWPVLIAVMFTLGGCNTETPRKTEPGRKEQLSSAAPAKGELMLNGEALFKQYCANCHPDGGNVSDPQRTLRSSALKANHITRPA